jgi:hypothetical protein
MQLPKVFLTFLSAVAIFAPYVLADLPACEITCERPDAYCGTPRFASSVVTLQATDNDPNVRLLVGHSSPTRFEATAHFNEGYMTLTTLDGPTGPFVFDIIWGNPGSKTYKLKDGNEGCQSSIPAGSSTFAGRAMFAPIN